MMKTEISLILTPCHWRSNWHRVYVTVKSIPKAERRKALHCLVERSQTEACWEHYFIWVLSTLSEYSFVQIKDRREETKIKVSGVWGSNSDFFFFFFGSVSKCFSIVPCQSKLFSGGLENSSSILQKVRPFQKSWKREVTHVIKTVGLQVT